MNQFQDYVRQWQKTEKALTKIKKKELSQYDYSKNAKIIDSMLQYACEHATPSETSGLIEQQRIFSLISADAN